MLDDCCFAGLKIFEEIALGVLLMSALKPGPTLGANCGETVYGWDESASYSSLSYPNDEINEQMLR